MCHPTVGDAWGELSAWVVATQTIPQPASAVDFTVTVRTGDVAASMEGGSAGADMVLNADATADTCVTCRGYVYEALASSSLAPSAGPMTRTLRLTYKNNVDGKVPAGTVKVYVVLSGYTQAGLRSTVRAYGTAAVESVSSTIRQ